MGVDRVIAVDLQRPGHPEEGNVFNVPVQSCITDSLGGWVHSLHCILGWFGLG